MHVLVIGQGIAGTWLSFFLEKAGITCTVIDDAQPNSATRVASGVINPVTGRQVAVTWQANTVLPFAKRSYQQLGEQLGKNLLHENGIVSFPLVSQMEEAYHKKIKAGCTYVSLMEQDHNLKDFFNYQLAEMLIKPAFGINLQQLLDSWRIKLQREGNLLDIAFEEEKLVITNNGLLYRGIKCDYLFYCQGIGVSRSKYWKALPFSLKKGEALLVDIPELPKKFIYKFGNITLVPWHTGHWWVGSTYEANFCNDNPTEAFRQKIDFFLQQTLKVPYSISGHLAAVRPATAERRPFAGLHPIENRIGILGGLGTKGVSLAPWLAWQICELLTNQRMIEPEVDVCRFKELLDNTA